MRFSTPKRKPAHFFAAVRPPLDLRNLLDKRHYAASWGAMAGGPGRQPVAGVQMAF